MSKQWFLTNLSLLPRLTILLGALALVLTISVVTIEVAHAEVEDERVNCSIFEGVAGFVDTGFGFQAKYATLDNATIHGYVAGNCPRYRCTWWYTSGVAPIPRNIEWFSAYNQSYVSIWHHFCY